jgi:mannose-1-phosphate guanylyltransferase
LSIKHYAVILAGGKGERFWPLSQTQRPKQFLDIFEGVPLIQQTIDRLKGFCHCSSRYLVVPKHLRGISRRYVSRKNLIIEPEQRNTAAAVCLAAMKIHKQRGDGILHIMPADHIIKSRAAFTQTLKSSHELCSEGYVVTYGITPDRPETGYGYIRLGKRIKTRRTTQAFMALGFTEKPGRATARRYIRSKKHLWNSGIFSFRITTILKETQRHAPAVYRGVHRYVESGEIAYFKKVPNISIDYAVMEKSKQLCVIRSKFSWDDVGSWLAFERYFKKSTLGNICIGDVKGLEIQDSIIYTSDIPCKAYGVKGLIIVVSPHGVLVCSKEKAPDLKRLMNA